MIKIKKISLLHFVLFVLPTTILSQNWTINSDQWLATDALGRMLSTESEAGAEKQEKLVGMFYWTWHQAEDPGGVDRTNLTELLAQYDDATVQAMMDDFNHSNWEGQTQFIWDEPLFGYYHTTDPWVLRKHAEMLADAGVDVVFFDCTNGANTWKDSYTILLEVWSQARLDGVKAPQIAFLLPFAASENSMSDIVELYTDLYQPALYQNLWFMWNDKPLIMGYPESLVPKQGTTAGLKFTATDPFYAVNATCPSWSNNIGNLTFKLFAWNNSYSESVNGIPLAEKNFVNFNDNEKIRLTFDELPAGEYVWELSDGTEQVGVWKWTDGDNDELSFSNGEVVSGSYESEIAYTPDHTFTPLTIGTAHEAVEISGLSISQHEVNAIKEFFTFRPGQPGYTQGPTRNDHWGWLESYPQHGFPSNSEDGIEQVCVSIAQNASQYSKGNCTAFNGPDTFGRNYTSNAGGTSGSWDHSEEAYLYGANFQQQWSRAFELDPKLVWVTGWNEWIFGRFEHWSGCGNAPTVASSFPDNFDKYRSRDIEPVKSWGNKGDVYYMQLVDYVRKFKGMEKRDTVSAPKTIDIADVSTWADVKPYYRSYKGNTQHRNHRGHGSWTYTNTSGRNDIIGAKVARDNEYVYFYVETDNVLTDRSDPNWMRLFIDIDRDKSTGWEGYDFIVNRKSPTDSALVEKSIDSWSWQSAGNAQYTVNEKSLVLKISYAALGLVDGDRLNFEFKWSDNMQEDDNVMDFYVNGDVAPGARFNYVYTLHMADDGFQYGLSPQGTNKGLKCELFEGSFDTIPQFNTLIATDTKYLSSVLIPETSITDFALNYKGFFEALIKDEFTFSLESDTKARLYINGNLLVESTGATGENSGTVKLMPGKHELKIEYISGKENPPKMIVKMQSSTQSKAIISKNLLSKYNVAPEVEIAFVDVQNYFSEIDEVLKITGSDPDGGFSKIEVFNHQSQIAESSSDGFIVKSLDAGNYSVTAKVSDVDGATMLTNSLNFEVRPAFNVPGTIKTEEYRKGSSVTVSNSQDTDGGYDIKAVYGNTDYPIDVASDGSYQLTFRVPASAQSALVKVKINGEELTSVDVGNTGSEDPYHDINTNVKLSEGTQILSLEFEGRVSIHRLDISVSSGIDPTVRNPIKVYPNPSMDYFIIRSDEPVESVTIYDVTGKKVEETSEEENKQIVVGSEITSGLYLGQARMKNGSQHTFRIVKR